MGKYAYLNLTQKMIKIRKMVPKLLRKRYSEEVPYDFVRLDDVYEYLTPALNKYGVDFEVLGEASTQLDASGNPAYLTPFGTKETCKKTEPKCGADRAKEEESQRRV